MTTKGLREVRIKRGFTQVELAKRTGLEQAQISQIERATDPNIGWHILRRLIRVLRVRPETLFPMDSSS